MDKNVEVETAQRQLNNKIGRGWSNENKKNFLRQPILVIDSSAIYQAKINRSVLALTVVMVVLTAFTVAINPLKIHDMIKLTALFGLLVFLLVWYYDP